ncbi:MAG: CRTAC1 family protein [Saprospiraceae bacterium]|nr:CRTAC1 family protein [Saprospiraceae bacterium]
MNVIAGDINDDGYQDLYVCNDFAENDYVYINQKNGTFKHSEKNIANHISFSSMGADIGDIDNDGREDIFITEMRPEDYRRSKTSMPAMNPAVFDSLRMYGIAFQFMHNTLLYNQGKGYYSEIAHMCNLDKTEWSWAPLIVDLNNDGLKDLFVATGHKRDVMDRDVDALIQEFKKSKTQFNSIGDLLSKLPTIKTTNYIFENKGNFTFSKVMKDWGMDQISFSNGAAAADLDNDGDLDLVVNNVDDDAFLYRNNNKEQNNSIRVKLVDYPGNKDGLGSKIQLEEDKSQYQFASVRRVRGYLSCTEEYTHFGIGKKQKAKSIKVTWPDGRVSVVKDPDANKVHLISYSKSKAPNSQVLQSKCYL